MKHSLNDLSRALREGRTTSRALVEDSLARIADPAGEGARAFLTLYATRARDEANWIDAGRAKGLDLPPLAGIPLAVKDLFDVAGEPTRAGSRALVDAAPAAADADAVRLCRRAGLVVIGKTNMTEFAFSGLGVNPHYSTPLSPYERARGRIPGGSSSGSAVAVADGMAPAALGSDTGGSCRIPAAFCGITGFKPTQRRVSLRGAFPLSGSLDSIGPLAGGVSCCAIVDDVLSGGAGEDVEPFPLSGLRVGVIEGYVDEGLDAAIAQAYEAALDRLAKAGARLMAARLPELAELPNVNRNGTLVEHEAFATHRALMADKGALYDPWVLARLEAGRTRSAADYMELIANRARIRARVAARSRLFDALALPTVPIVPSGLDELTSPEVSRAINGKTLRNTAIGNFLDRPSISIPCHASGAAPAGFMLMGESGEDKRLLSIARGAEAAIRGAA